MFFFKHWICWAQLKAPNSVEYNLTNYIWQTTYDKRHLTNDIWHLPNNIWQSTSDKWHLKIICDILHMTNDKNLRKLNTTWNFLKNLGINWHILKQLDATWWNLTQLDATWHNLTQLDTNKLIHIFFFLF
jgi:hypothetical protein